MENKYRVESTGLDERIADCPNYVYAENISALFSKSFAITCRVIDLKDGSIVAEHGNGRLMWSGRHLPNS